MPWSVTGSMASQPWPWPSFFLKVGNGGGRGGGVGTVILSAVLDRHQDIVVKVIDLLKWLSPLATVIVKLLWLFGSGQLAQQLVNLGQSFWLLHLLIFDERIAN